eukprot:2857743-Rhodomonas_salina.2
MSTIPILSLKHAMHIPAFVFVMLQMRHAKCLSSASLRDKQSKCFVVSSACRLSSSSTLCTRFVVGRVCRSSSSSTLCKCFIEELQHALQNKEQDGASVRSWDLSPGPTSHVPRVSVREPVPRVSSYDEKLPKLSTN